MVNLTGKFSPCQNGQKFVSGSFNMHVHTVRRDSTGTCRLIAFGGALCAGARVSSVAFDSDG